MNVELRKVKYNEKMSDETSCFSAEVWMDGKKLADVSNRGCGGGNDYYSGHVSEWDKFVKWCNSQPPVVSYGMTLPMNADLYIGDLFDAWLVKDDVRRQQAQLKRWCRTKTVYRLKGDDPGTWRIFSRAYDAVVKEFLQKKHGDRIETIANEGVAA
jgi:hypothetical protein